MAWLLGADETLGWSEQVLLETKRVACALINEVYDLHLAVRTTKMLQVPYTLNSKPSTINTKP